MRAAAVVFDIVFRYRVGVAKALLPFAVMVPIMLSVAARAGEQDAPVKPGDEASALRYSRTAIGRQVGDHSFTNSLNRKVTLADYRGKPLVVSPIYTGCADICPVVSETLADAVEVAREAIGDDSFRVVTVGFDARHDTPARMRAFALSHGLDMANWEFLSADGDTVDRLAEDIGFVFFPSPKGFDHMSQTTVLDSEGRVYRQIYGAAFETPLLVEPLKQLVFGGRIDMQSWDGIVNRVRLFCTIYNPATGRYRFDYSIFISMVVGSLTLGAIAFVLVRAWLRGRRLRAG
jgi:protein SCO1/2